MTEPYPVLYSFRRCPYAMRARLALAVSGQTCRLREVVLRDKPSQMLEISPKATVPVLQLEDGTVLEESRDIMDWALGRSDPENWLAGDVAAMRALVDECDGPFKQALDRYKYPNRYDLPDGLEHRAKGLVFLEKLNTLLDGKPNLFGEVSYADAAIFPFVRQFANTDRTWFDGLDLPNLQRWLATHLEGPLFASIMPKYAQWRAGDEEPLFPPR
ncbi:glutathione S-transferase [Hyphomonas sp. FCG-A18]|uniref:glutathione S-transferase n=1 Tax=Hyphomonas sp. FCG-A18 TaxID=3080019 RepID=UPI002B2FF761|nr:glutathione S-transferase [Hyphomonas sp. FCG-A18]